MTWSINDRPIAFDRSGEVVEFLKTFRPLESLSISQPWHCRNDFQFSASRTRFGRQLPRPNWAEQPPIELYRLWMPTGASRWGQTAVLVGQEDMAAIRESQASDGRTLTLKVDEGITYPFHLLQETPVDTRDGQLYLLTLVDARYFWQFREFQLSITSSTTWDDVIDDLKTELGWGTVSTVSDARFGVPDSTELTRYGNAALLADAVLSSVGLTVSIEPGQTEFVARKAIPPALENQSMFPDVDENRIAGFPEEHRYRFEKLRLVCRRMIDGQVRDDLEPFTTEHDFGYLDSQFEPGHIATLYTTAFAKDTQANYDVDPTTPTNLSAIEDLRDVIAEDFDAWNRGGYYDQSYSGIVNPGYEVRFIDFVEYQIAFDGRPRARVRGTSKSQRYEPTSRTRVRSMPPYYGAGYQLSQDEYTDEADKARWIKFKLTEALTTSASEADADVEAFYDGPDPGASVAVQNLETNTASTYVFEGAIEDVGYAFYDPGGDQYFIAQIEC